MQSQDEEPWGFELVRMVRGEVPHKSRAETIIRSVLYEVMVDAGFRIRPFGRKLH
jgi:hypothetical protein